MILNRLAKFLGKLTVGTKAASRSFTPIDTNPIPRDWTHITKIDPEDEKKLPLLYPAYLTHTSAISVGGSRDVNSKNTEETFELLDIIETPVFHEPSAARHVTRKTRELSEFLAIPEVLNGDSTALIGTLGEGTEYLRREMIPQLIEDKIPWAPEFLKSDLADFLTSYLLRAAVFEAYIIQNENSAAAREANVTHEDLLSPDEAAQRALAAEKHLESPVIYLEYSGTYGDDEAADILEAIDHELGWSRLWYGGGISNREEATNVLEAGADTVVVGNIFHEIATEEEEISNSASEEFDSGATVAQITDWLDQEFEVEKTNGYKFLSTIPSVTRPKDLSHSYLAKTITLRLIIEELTGNGSRDIAVDELKRKVEQSWDTTAVDSELPSDYVHYLNDQITLNRGRNDGQSDSNSSHIQGLVSF